MTANRLVMSNFQFGSGLRAYGLSDACRISQNVFYDGQNTSIIVRIERRAQICNQKIHIFLLYKVISHRRVILLPIYTQNTPNFHTQIPLKFHTKYPHTSLRCQNDRKSLLNTNVDKKQASPKKGLRGWIRILWENRWRKIAMIVLSLRLCFHEWRGGAAAYVESRRAHVSRVFDIPILQHSYPISLSNIKLAM